MALNEDLKYLISKYGKQNILNELNDYVYMSAAKKRYEQKRIEDARNTLTHSKGMLIRKFQNQLKRFDWFNELNCSFEFKNAGIVERINLHFNELPLQTHINKKWNNEEPTIPQHILNDIINTCKQFNNLIHGMDYYGYYWYKHTMISFIILSREIVEKTPKKLFHVTTEQSINSILKNGLKPQSAGQFWETYYYNALFAFQKLSDTRKFIKHAPKNQKYLIVEFKPELGTMFYKDLIEMNDGLKSAVYTHDSIRPENITGVYNMMMEPYA